MSAVTREIVPGMAEAIATQMRKRKLTPTTLAERTGLTVQGLAPLRRGERRAYQDRLKLPVAEALGWTPDSIDRLLAGEPPVELKPPSVVGGLSFDAVVAEVREAIAEIHARLDRLEQRESSPPVGGRVGRSRRPVR